MGCCGRPDNRSAKNSQEEYYKRYAYLNHHQKAQKEALLGTKCQACDALTFNDPEGNCSVCKGSKQAQT